jgi:histidine triad (HIT) family protein
MHAPESYACPFCALANGISIPGLLSSETDVFYRDDRLVAFVSSHTWPGSEGNILIAPGAHYENIYNLPDDLVADIAVFAKRIAKLYKEIFAVDGVTIRQHNEPAGNQDVWHYHVQVLPRTEGASLYAAHSAPVRQTREDADRVAEALRKALFH